MYFRTHTLTHSHSHSLTLTLTNTYIHNHTYTHIHTLTITHTHTRALTRALAITQTYTLTLTHNHTHTHALALTRTLRHTHTHSHLHNSEYPYGSENEPVMVSEMSIRVNTVFTKHGNHANRRNCTTPQNCSPWRNMSKLKARYQLNDCLQARASLITTLHTCRWWAHDTSDQRGERLTDWLRL